MLLAIFGPFLRMKRYIFYIYFLNKNLYFTDLAGQPIWLLRNSLSRIVSWNWRVLRHSSDVLQIGKQNQRDKITCPKTHSHKVGKISWCPVQWFVFSVPYYPRKNKHMSGLRESWLSEIRFFSFLICFAFAVSPEVKILWSK